MRLKRLACLMLAVLALFAGSASAQEAADSAFILAGLDTTQYRDWLNNQFFTRMEEKTGVRFIYHQYTKEEDWTKAKGAMDKGDADLPDVLFKAALTGEECISLREKGVLIDLKPYLQESCPHLWAILEENPEMWDAITLPDGSVAALPFITFTPSQNYMWVNREWLSSLKLEEPATALELADVLAAFKTRDPNRNGKQDEIPMGFLGPFDLKFLAHAFGLIANDYNIFVRDGQVQFMPLEDNYRLFVTWCRDLYADGLLDKNGFTLNDQMRTVTDSNAAPTYGVILTNMAADIFQTTWAENYDILMPLSFGGQRIYRSFYGPVLRGTFAVTSRCREPEKLLEWVDCLYTEEGSVLASIGQENVDYLVDGDGTWRLLDANQSNYELYRAGTLIEGGGEAPGILAEDFQRGISGGDMVVRILDRQKQFDAFVELPFPYYTLTAEQQAEISALQNRIGYEVDMQLARWVKGEDEITDESFAAFRERMEEMGLQDFLAFWQKILDER